MFSSARPRRLRCTFAATRGFNNLYCAALNSIFGIKNCRASAVRKTHFPSPFRKWQKQIPLFVTMKIIIISSASIKSKNYFILFPGTAMAPPKFAQIQSFSPLTSKGSLTNMTAEDVRRQVVEAFKVNISPQIMSAGLRFEFAEYRCRRQRYNRSRGDGKPYKKAWYSA